MRMEGSGREETERKGRRGRGIKGEHMSRGPTILTAVPGPMLTRQRRANNSFEGSCTQEAKRPHEIVIRLAQD
jgi:hypothetical protein